MNRVTEKHLLVPGLHPLLPKERWGSRWVTSTEVDMKSGWLTHTRRMRRQSSNLMRRVIASEPLKLANSTGEKPKVKKKIP